MSPTIRKPDAPDSWRAEIERIAAAGGMTPLREAGERPVRESVTTAAEPAHVLG